MIKLAAIMLLSVSAGGYPVNMNKAFLENCVGFHEQMLAPCRCVLRGIQQQIPYSEFQTLAEQQGIKADRRIQAIQQRCASEHATKRR